MAKEKEMEAKKSKLPMMIIIILALIIGLAGGAFGVDKYIHKEPQSALAQSESQVLASKAVMVPLSTFTINLAKTPGDNTDHYIKINLSVAVNDAKAKAALKTKLPIIRDSVITVLSQKNQNDILSNSNNLQTLKNQLKNKINDGMGLDIVNDVYITDMVLQ